MSGWFDDLPSTYLARSPHLGQAIIGSWHQTRSFGAYASYSNILRTILPVPLHALYAWSALEFDFAQAGTKSMQAADWLADGELVVASRPAAGRWRATVELSGIKLADLVGSVRNSPANVGRPFGLAQ